MSCNELLDQLRAEKQKADNWYNLWGGPKNLRELAARLHLLSTYEALYRAWSTAAHGEGAIKRIGERGKDGRVELEALRTPAGLSQRSLEAVVITNYLTFKVVDELVGHLRLGVESWYFQHMKPRQNYILSKPIA